MCSSLLYLAKRFLDATLFFKEVVVISSPSLYMSKPMGTRYHNVKRLIRDFGQGLMMRGLT